MASTIAIGTPVLLVIEVHDVAVHPNLEARGTMEFYCVQNHREPQPVNHSLQLLLAADHHQASKARLLSSPR